MKFILRFCSFISWKIYAILGVLLIVGKILDLHITMNKNITELNKNNQESENQEYTLQELEQQERNLFRKRSIFVIVFGIIITVTLIIASLVGGTL